MNYLSGALRYVAGGESDAQDVVPRLIDRIKTSVLPQDRRAAIAALTETAKHSPDKQKLIGEQAIKVIYAVLEQDKEYEDTLKATLELLIAICGTLDPPSLERLQEVLGDDGEGINQQEQLKHFEATSARSAATNVDIFLGLPNAVTLLLQMLENPDFYVKFGTIELLTAMAANSRNTLQTTVLEAPQGVTRICDLLDDSHRHVRSNAVLLLSTLCEGSSEICKIVAYGGVLEKLFALVEAVSGTANQPVRVAIDDDDEEDSLEASIVVQDVLLVLRNLIDGASTTRTFFRDTGCLPRLVHVVRKAAIDIQTRPADDDTASGVVGVKVAVEKQARKNLIVAMQCLSGLVRADDDESRVIKNDIAATNLFTLLCTLAFTSSSKLGSSASELPEKFLQVRVSALKTLAMLTRGHDAFRSMFSVSKFSTSLDGVSKSPQLAALRLIYGDPSSAVRAASYSAFRESFVVDAGLDMPSSALVNAFVASGGISGDAVGVRSHGPSTVPSLPSVDGASKGNVLHLIADSLKSALVGYPGVDTAAVFYAARIFSWVTNGVQGARERLLEARVSGNSLLPSIIRLLARLERERGPAEIRIALFSFVCTWLHGNSSAISAFLSSAMHLPFLVDVVVNTGSRGDIAEVHVRGLAAVVLGICLHVPNNAGGSGKEGGFLSSGSGASTVVSQQTVADVVVNRIGMTTFTACLDDLRASKSFSQSDQGEDLWSLVDSLSSIEERIGFQSIEGRLGHDQWYGPATLGVVNEVYAGVGAKALDLMTSNVHKLGTVGNATLENSSMNGYGADKLGTTPERALLADSARDEVLSSYKEFIRSQDESLNDARRQINELTIALRETQAELDTRSDAQVNGSQRGFVEELQQSNSELKGQNDALETLLEEKTADFSALSNAYAALEEDHASFSTPTIGEGASAADAELSALRTQMQSISQSLNSEITKNAELSRRLVVAENSIEVKETERTAVLRERDSLISGSTLETADLLQWRTRAEVAEAKAQSQKTILDAMESSVFEAEKRFNAIDQERGEAILAATTLREQFAVSERALEELRSARKREMQIAREAAASADRAAQMKITSLREELKTAKTAQREVAAGVGVVEDRKRVETLENNNQVLQISVSQLQSEILDARNAIDQWQKKAISLESTKQREIDENSRLSNVIQVMDSNMKAMQERLDSFDGVSSASSLRITELERQSTELDEMRRRAQDEAALLKEEVAARTEQSIRLSGQLYEMQEAKSKDDEELTSLRNALSSKTGESAKEHHENISGQDRTGGRLEATEKLLAKIAAVEEELELTKDSLADSRDRESLEQAQARDREEAVQRVVALEHKLAESEQREFQLAHELELSREKLLSLDEAESSKRELTMQVVSLQQALDQSSNVSEASHDNHVDTLVKEKNEAKQHAEQISAMLSETNIQISQLTSSLSVATDRSKLMEQEKTSLEKQLAEAEAMCSVVASERDELMERCSDLTGQLEAAPSAPTDDEHNRSQILNLQSQLSASEKRKNAVARELSSLIEACRLSEQEVGTMRTDNKQLENQNSALKAELHVLRTEVEDLVLVREVGPIVSSMTIHAVQSATSDETAAMLARVSRERDSAIEARNRSVSRLKSLQNDMAGLQVALSDQEKISTSCSLQAAQLAELTAEVSTLRNVAREKDDIQTNLENARASIAALEEERNTSDTERSRGVNAYGRSFKSDSGSIEVGHTESAASQQRVTELESALRDAARTVAATNSELIGAQALLVELSADKTAIRTELTAAQEQIQTLSARISVESPVHQHESALSEVSEAESSVHEASPDPSLSASQNEVLEQDIKIAIAEAENLRTALGRTAIEADSAYSFLSQIDASVGTLEEELTRSRSELQNSKCVERTISANISELQGSLKKERETHQQAVAALRLELSNLHHAASKEAAECEEQLAHAARSQESEHERHEAEVRDRESTITEITNRCSELQRENDSSARRLEEVSQKLKDVDASNTKYAYTSSVLEGTVSDVKRRLEQSQGRENELMENLKRTQNALDVVKEHFAEERKQLEDERVLEVSEFEAEIERTTAALEEAERKLRDTDLLSKSQIARLEEKLSTVTRTLDCTNGELESTLKTLTNVKSEHLALQADLNAERESRKRMIAEVSKEKELALMIAETRTKERDENQRELDKTTDMLRTIRGELREESDQKSMLESENEDLVSTVDDLESNARSLRKDLKESEQRLDLTRGLLEESELINARQAARLEGLQDDLASRESHIKQIRNARAQLEDERDHLQHSLESTEAAKERVEQDNKDLKTWVADLERQATELQSAAEHFEEVEQSLREALETQRDMSEQNSDLAGELKKQKDALASVETQLRNAMREKSELEAARASWQRKANDLQSRIRGIRDENMVKFSNSADVIRAKSQRCAELETELAAAESKVAELATDSDSLFGVKAELEDKERDVQALRERAECAERKVDDLQLLVQSMESEVADMREMSTGDAYRNLEAEHNELLVCLADLELECTTLKEELGRE